MGADWGALLWKTVTPQKDASVGDLISCGYSPIHARVDPCCRQAVVVSTGDRAFVVWRLPQRGAA